MYSNLIDQETFAAVVAAAPKVAEYKLELAREIVGLLDRVGFGSMKVSELAMELGGEPRRTRWAGSCASWG